MTNLTATSTIIKRENFSVNLGILACIAMIIVSLSACAVEDECNYLTLNREIQVPYDVEGDTTVVSVDSDRSIVDLQLYMDEEYQVEFPLRSITILVNDAELIDWDNTVITLNSMMPSPEIEIIDSSYANSIRIRLVWRGMTFTRESHKISFELAFNRDVPVGTRISFWVENTHFRSNIEEESFFQGKPDGFLGNEEASGVRTRRYPRDENEEVVRYDSAPGTITFTD